MKTLTSFLLVFFAFEASGYLIKVPTATTQTRAPSVGWIHIQKLILPLFENVCEVCNNPTIVRLSQEFEKDMGSSLTENYLKPEVIGNLQKLKSGKGLLPKGEIFSEYNNDHVNELKIIYEIMFYAKDFDTFYKTASWARQNINCGLFIDAIYLTIMQRKDTQRISLPALYELLPNYFIRKDVIIKASNLLAGEDVLESQDIRYEGNSYILDASYTTNPNEVDDDTKLAYFHEDVGLNTYFFLKKLSKFLWLTTIDVNSRYGEHIYHMLKQFTTRYNLERISNGLPELESINWDSFSVTPYDPLLIYSNGEQFCQIGNSNYPIEKINFLKNIETNIPAVVTHMRDSGYNKTQIINHLIEIVFTGDKSYETVARQLLTEDVSANTRQKTVLDHYMTLLREPVIWRLKKNMLDLISSGLAMIPQYTRNELYFPGIEILNVEVKKMLTSFDTFMFDVTDSLKTSTGNGSFQVKIAQSRLNHKPFTIKLNMTSLVAQRGLVKIFLGPKFMPGDFISKKNMFMVLDSFQINLKKGVNLVTRSSDEMNYQPHDYMSLRTLRKKVEDSEFGLDALPLETMNSQIRMLSRLVLPKGSPEGLPLQMFVFIAPFVKSGLVGTHSSSVMELNSEAIYSPEFPLDLDINVKQLLDLPNAMLKDVIITHKGGAYKGGFYSSTKDWQSGGTYDRTADLSSGRKEPYNYRMDNMQNEDDDLEDLVTDNDSANDRSWNSRKTYSYPRLLQYSPGRKQPFDYQSKRGQYGKKADYAARRSNYSREFSGKTESTIETTTILTTDNEEIIEAIVNTNGDEEFKIFKKNNNNINEISEPILIVKDNPQSEEIVIPLPRKKVPTIYDYLINGWEEVKVYE